MDFGIGYFPTHDGVDPATFARLVEERGHRSLFFPEHTHIPASRETPYPAGGELPRVYSHTYDLFVSLAAAATATSTLRIASGICLVIERDPILTAKEVASVDHLSGGRLDFGVGAGWNREEMRNHGTDPRTRMELMAERVEAMKAIWTEDEASYEGQYVNFERIWSWPKPVQRPHPPVLVGGNGPTVLDRVLRFGDGWMPNNTGEDLIAARPGAVGPRRSPARGDRDGSPREGRAARAVRAGRDRPRRALDPLDGPRPGRAGARALGARVGRVPGHLAPSRSSRIPSAPGRAVADTAAPRRPAGRPGASCRGRYNACWQANNLGAITTVATR